MVGKRPANLSSSADVPPNVTQGSNNQEVIAGPSSKVMKMTNPNEGTSGDIPLTMEQKMFQLIFSYLDIEELLAVRRVNRIWAQISSHEITTRPRFIMPFSFGDTDWRKGYTKTKTLPVFMEILQGNTNCPWEFPYVRFQLNFSDFGGFDFEFDDRKSDKKKTADLPGSLLQFYAAHGSRIKYLGFDADRHASRRAIRCMITLLQNIVTPSVSNRGALGASLEALDFSGWDAVFTGPMTTPFPKAAIGSLLNLKTLEFGPLGSDQRGYFLDWILQAAPGIKECKYVASNPTDGYGHDSGRYTDWSVMRTMKKLDLISEVTIIIGHGVVNPGIGKVISSARFLKTLSIDFAECGASDWKEVQKILEACKGTLQTFRMRSFDKVHAGFKVPTLPQLKTVHLAGYKEAALVQLATSSATAASWPKLETLLLYGPLTWNATEPSGSAKGKGKAKKKTTKPGSVELTAFSHVRTLKTGFSCSYTAIVKSFPNLKNLALLKDDDDDDDDDDDEENSESADVNKGKFNPKLWSELSELRCLEVLHLPLILSDAEVTGILKEKCKELKGKEMDVKVERQGPSILELKDLKRLGLWANKMEPKDIDSTMTEISAIYGFRMMTPPIAVGITVPDLSAKNRKTELEQLSIGPFVTFV